jgi:hypothetical protein
MIPPTSRVGPKDEKIPTSELPREVQQYAPPPRPAERPVERSVERQGERQVERPVERPTSSSVAKRAPAISNATDLHKFLEKRARQLGASISVLDQQRQHLRSVEAQRDTNSQEFASAVDKLNETARLLKDGIAGSARSDELDRLADNHQDALEQLEHIVFSANTTFQYWQATWDQYQKTCKRTEELKAEMAASEPLTDA